MITEYHITAEFVGEDGSLAYTRGRTYRLTVQAPYKKWPLAIVGGGPICPYGSWEAFNRNWLAIKSEKAGRIP